MVTTLYSTIAIQHLADDAKLTDLPYVKTVKLDAINNLEKNNTILSGQEYNYIKSTITRCAVPIIHYFG